MKGNGYEARKTSLFMFLLTVLVLTVKRTTVHYGLETLMCWGNRAIETFLIIYLARVYVNMKQKIVHCQLWRFQRKLQHFCSCL